MKPKSCSRHVAKPHRCSCIEDIETAAEAIKRAGFSAGTYLRYVEHETGEADAAYLAVLAAESRTTA